MHRPRFPSRRALAASSAGLTILGLGAAEVGIPAVADRQVRRHAAAVAPVESVHVEVRPAIKALWGDIDRVDVRLGDGEIDPRRLHDEGVLERLRGVDHVRASARSLRSGPIAADDDRLAKDAGQLTARLTLDLARLRAALPGAQLRPYGSADGLTLDLRAPQLPIPGSLRIRVSAEDGALVAQPEGAAAALIGPRRLLSTEGLSLDRLASRVDGDRVALELQGHL